MEIFKVPLKSDSENKINVERAVKKKFFTSAEKAEIKRLRETGLNSKEIAEIFKTTPRHIRDLLRYLNKDYNPNFTQEEDNKLIKYYNTGITKEWALREYFPNKLPYMIRNRIRSLLKKGVIRQGDTFQPPSIITVVA